MPETHSMITIENENFNIQVLDKFFGCYIGISSISYVSLIDAKLI